MAEWLVTGANGFLGRYLCLHLKNADREVSALVRRPDVWLESIGVNQIVCSDWLTDLTSPRLKKVAFVVHCAGNAVFGNGRRYITENVLLTRSLVDALKIAAPDLQRLVLVSSIGAVDRSRTDDCSSPLDETSPACPTSDYGRSKLEAEKVVRASGLPFAILRPALVVGKDMRFGSHFSVFARGALNKALWTSFAWPGEFSVVHASDVAAALLLIAEHPDAAGETFFCAGEKISLALFLRSVAPGRARLPLAAGLLPGVGGGLCPFKLKAMLRPALVASDAKLRSLGWAPRVSAAEALAEVTGREKARNCPRTPYEGQTVITGAASGLGRALVEQLISHRRNILGVDVDAEGLENLRLVWPKLRTLQADLSSEKGLRGCLESPEWRSAPILELFTCAGRGLRGEMEHLERTELNNIYALNVLGSLNLAHAALPGMRKRQFGRIVFISSSAAFQPLPFMACYASSKAALLSLGLAWAQELKDSGIHILTVCPGGMKTNFQPRSGVKEVPGEKLMLPEKAAARIVQALGKGRPLLIFPFRAWSMSMIGRLLPRPFLTRLWGFLMRALR